MMKSTTSYSYISPRATIYFGRPNGFIPAAPFKDRLPLMVVAERGEARAPLLMLLRVEVLEVLPY
jgi:septum formation topological specificity factor MinE